MEVGVRTSDFFEEINIINNINNILLILKKYNISFNVTRSKFMYSENFWLINSFTLFIYSNKEKRNWVAQKKWTFIFVHF
jgi:hypothetical protein